MKITLGDPVWSQDFTDIGTLCEVILNASATSVRSIVLQPSGLKTEDVEIPIKRIQPARADRHGITVQCTAEEIAKRQQESEIVYAAMDSQIRRIAKATVVLDRNGTPLGNVKQLTFDAENGEFTSFRIRRGYLFREEVELPASSISTVRGDTVTVGILDNPCTAWIRSVGLILF